MIWTDTTVLTALQDVNYACIFVDLPDETVKCGPGKEKWQEDLEKLTGRQRVALEEKITRWQKRVAS